MASGLDFPTFYDRFEELRRRLRRHLSWQTLTVLAICSLSGLIGIASLDYRFEIPWSVRAAALGFSAGAGVVLAGWLLIAGLKSWTRYRTASAIERKFPELGQRVRTTIEYRNRSVDQMKSVGVAPGLVRALETEAAISTLPLPLENLIPVGRLMVLTGLATGIFGFVASSGMWHGDWQTAIRRALLADESFSRLTPGTVDSTVDRGNAITLGATLEGRSRDTASLRTRPIDRDGGTWDVQTFAAKEAEPTASGGLSFETSIPNITAPFEFQWVAGPEKSPVYRVDVRYPLLIVSVAIEVTPPEYTGLPTATNSDGHVNAPESSHAKFVVELDGVPASARVAFKPSAKSKFDDPEVQIVNATIEGKKLYFERTLDADAVWVVDAMSAHGLPVAANSYRIRVRKDQPPSVAFEAPDESLDVHSLAEILMRIRVSDDFGLVRAGIVFQINNDEEHILFAEDYQQAAEELRATGTLTPKTSATLEKVLPLEHFNLIQKDAVTYYAFAEDNRPNAMQRTETDLRFIDIRPFKTIYRQPPPGDGMNPNNDPGPRRATFEELINRERATLNRTLAMKRSGKQDLGGLDRLMKFQGETAELTNGLGRFLQAQAARFNIPQLLDNADLLFQAERAMLDSVDSMSVGKYDVAMLQEKDAVRFLIESRDRLEVILQESKNPSELQKAINEYSRQQQTKLRKKPKMNQEEQQKAQELLEQLAQLAAKQAMVAAQMDSVGTNGGAEPSDDAQEPADDSQSTADGKQSEEGKPPESGASEKSQTGEKGDKEKDGDSTEKKGKSGAMPRSEKKPGPRGTMSREEIAKNQQEIATDAAGVQKELEQMKGATDLAKRRMSSATESAEAASGAMTRGNTKEAAKSANDAAEKFEQMLTLAKGLLAPELSDQLGVARDLADDISRQEEDLANAGSPSEKPSKPGEGMDSADDNEKRESIAKQAEKLAAAGESFADILNNASKSTSAADQKSISKVTELLDKGGVSSAVERMQQQPTGIRGGRLNDEKKAATEIADKFDEAARKLDSIQRELVNPRIAELMKLEARAEALEAELDDVETKRQAEQWHQAAGEFLDEVDEGEGGGGDEDLKEQMKQFGWDRTTNTLKGFGGGGYQAKVYKKSLKAIADELRDRVQQLLLAELTSTGDETPPVQYDGMVTRYQKALTMGIRGNQTKTQRAKERRTK